MAIVGNKLKWIHSFGLSRYLLPALIYASMEGSWARLPMGLLCLPMLKAQKSHFSSSDMYCLLSFCGNQISKLVTESITSNLVGAVNVLKCQTLVVCLRSLVKQDKPISDCF